MLAPELFGLHAGIGVDFRVTAEFEEFGRQWVEGEIGVLRVVLHLHCLQELGGFEHHEHVVLGHHLFARRKLCELLADVDAFDVVDRRLDGDTNVGAGNAEGAVGVDVERTGEAEVARIVRAERHLDAFGTGHVGGVFDEVAVESYGTLAGDGAEKLRLHEADVVLVDIDFGEDVLQHRGEDVARVDEFIHARCALALHDGLLLVFVLAIDFLRHRFVHRKGEDEFAGFG